MDFPVRIPFVKALGFELLRFENGEAEIAIEPREDLTNSWGVTHGGVIMTLLDVVMAHAARSLDAAANAPRPGVVTIEMKSSFMRPGTGRLLGRGRLLHRTWSMSFCVGYVQGADGQLVAHGTGTFKYLEGLPAGGRKINRQNSASD
jgi:uncharacterized protein (TIGR00369 family)